MNSGSSIGVLKIEGLYKGNVPSGGSLWYGIFQTGDGSCGVNLSVSPGSAAHSDAQRCIYFRVS